MKPGRAFITTCLLGTMAGSYSVAICAANGWDKNAGLTVQTIFSDNLNLTRKDRKSDIGVRVTPSIGLIRDSRYNKLYFQYGLSYLEHSQSGADSDFSHSMTANWQSELQRDWLFLDVSANAAQALLSRTGASSGDDFNNTDNQTQTFTYYITPYTRHHFGSYADLELRYTHDGVLIESGTAGDSFSNGLSFSFDSGRAFQALSWSVNGSYSQVERDSSDAQDKYRNARARVNYAINRYWAPFVYVAYQDNDFSTSSDNPSGSVYGAGVTWSPKQNLSFELTYNSEGANIGAGVRWNPNERTSLDLSYGNDFLRKAWSFNFSHRQRSSSLSASYSEDFVSTARDELLARETFQQFDNFGNPILDPVTGRPIFITLDSPDLNDETYILKRFTLSYDILIGKRNSVAVSSSYSNREYQVSKEKSDTLSASVNWSRKLAANLNSDLGLSWNSTDSQTSDGGSEQWFLNAGLSYRLTAKTTVAFNLQHVEKDSDEDASNYSENRATLTVGTRW